MSINKSGIVPPPTQTDPENYKVVFENDKVRVYDYTDSPGHKTQHHHHDAFILYALSPFKRKLIFDDGNSVVREFKGGETIWSEAQNHIGENIGDTDTHVLIVEIKQ